MVTPVGQNKSVIHKEGFCGVSDSMSYGMQLHVEQCVQEKFWLPAIVEEGQFLQLSCGCLKQSTRSTGAHYCYFHLKMMSVAYVGFWNTLYSLEYTLYDGPVSYETHQTLRYKMDIILPLVSFF